MKKLIVLAILAGSATGCATIFGPPPAPGDSADAVRARLGTPTATYVDGADTLLEYAYGPLGQYTYMARLGPDGLLRSYEQVLTSEKFATVRPGKDTKDSILRTFGRPAEVVHYASVDGDVWGYRYKEQDVWNSTMHIEFDRAGVVQAMVNGPDYERESRFFR